MARTPDPTTSKTCCRCKSKHPRRLFPHGGRQCRRCYKSAYHSRRYRKNPEGNRKRYHQWKRRMGREEFQRWRREKNFLLRYGITTDQYHQMIEAQGHRCAICRKPPQPGKQLVVDHKHGTTPVFVRAALCNKCNTVLGYVDESVRVLKTAIRYIERWERARKRKRTGR